MPYALTFTKPLTVPPGGDYINDCCIAGDVVFAQLLPGLKPVYGELTPTEEDWGWFIWFLHGPVRLAVDVHTHDHQTGEFEIHLTSRIPRLLRSSRIADTPELDVLRDLVVKQLDDWQVTDLVVTRVDEKYN